MARSASYPSYKLLQSLEFVEKIYEHYPSSDFISREDIAKALKSSPYTLIIPLSTASQYGILDLKSKKGYKPSEAFSKIRKPLNESEKNETLIQCFKSPTLYEALISEYEGKELPSITGLATVLFRKHRIAENASEKVASVFLDNVNELGLNRDGKLVLQININETPSPKIHAKINEQEEPEGEEKTPQTDIRKNKDGLYQIQFPLDSGKGYLYLPNEITKEDYDFIVNIVPVYTKKLIRKSPPVQSGDSQD